MDVLLNERVNDLRHSLFYLVNCLIMTASELYNQKGEELSWCPFGQIVCDKDEIVDWRIVLVEMPLTRYEDCWPLR